MAGTYSHIFTAGPVSAEKGSIVEIEAKIRNLHSSAIWLQAKGRVNGTSLLFGSVSKIVAAGAIESWYDRFVMPGQDVLVTVVSFYWGTDSKWHSDDEATRNITLLAEQPVPSSEFRNLSVAVR